MLALIVPVHAQTPSEAPKQPPKTCQELIPYMAVVYGLNAEMEARLYETLRRESMNFTAEQSFVPKATGPNGREDSWGCAQIHLPDHPTVTREQALDPTFAVSFAAKHFASGDMWMWTEYRKLYGR